MQTEQKKQSKVNTKLVKSEFQKASKGAKNSLKIVSLFSGSGGMDLGFEQEGFDVIWANDVNHWACETFKNYFGDHIVEGSIVDVKTDDIPCCDIVLGGFPCQDFSMVWKRMGLKTERGNLYRQFVRIVVAKQPKMFVAENVKGLLSANKGKAVEQIRSDFAEAGYKVTVNPINFASYGAPQLRERVLIIGVRNDIKKDFELPAPTRGPGNYVTAKEALRGVEKAIFNNEHQNINPSTIAKLRLIPPGGNFTDIPKTSPHYVKGMISHVYRRLHPDKPSTTIIAGGGGGTWGYHFNEPRPLTNRERARLFGYPDDFVFAGSIAEVRRQIGNSVPPAGIRPIARAIKKFLSEL
ncbi:DNA cytosine methyltransferase [Candidatus Giovannonibacteria bacterium]|nr:DNA cytosine methyltransferase [Candidatus Giovannonibacteria bacterium]